MTTSGFPTRVVMRLVLFEPAGRLCGWCSPLVVSRAKGCGERQASSLAKPPGGCGWCARGRAGQRIHVRGPAVGVPTHQKCHDAGFALSSSYLAWVGLCLGFAAKAKLARLRSPSPIGGECRDHGLPPATAHTHISSRGTHRHARTYHGSTSHTQTCTTCDVATDGRVQGDSSQHIYHGTKPSPHEAFHRNNPHVTCAQPTWPTSRKSRTWRRSTSSARCRTAPM